MPPGHCRMPVFMRGGPGGLYQPAGPHSPRQSKSGSVTVNTCAIGPYGTPAAPLAPSSCSPTGLSWLSSARERANINIEKEDIMNTSTGSYHSNGITRQDVYTRVTDRIAADLERGVRPWVKPWSARAAEKITRPLRHNGAPYSGINILMLWSAAIAGGFAAPHLDDIQASLRAERACPQGREGAPSSCMRYHHAQGNR